MKQKMEVQVPMVTALHSFLWEKKTPNNTRNLLQITFWNYQREMGGNVFNGSRVI